jgi:uracil phosphoribosyltransferase
MLIDASLNELNFTDKTIVTPTGDTFVGKEFPSGICGVSIMRSGDSMVKGLREVCKDIRIGKILVQRDEKTARPTLMYTKFPEDIANRFCLLLDPMLATGGSASMAINALIGHGVIPKKIVLVTMIAAPEGLSLLRHLYPSIHIVTACIDRCLNDKKYILPGIGDFGDRYFGTEV